ncbi:MAG: hypothetical protein NXH75_04060 [Halobacteriovoraceae bacterium]|nr:hypothetical protein [Halobacteriovoraceae bacterium]
MNQFLDALFFLFRYIPFWTIPIIMICAQFGYVYWVKEVRNIAWILYSVAMVNGIFLIYYVYAGSPENSARILDELIRNLAR